MFRTMRTRPRAARRAVVLLTLVLCAVTAGVTAAIAAATETPTGLAATATTDGSGTGSVVVTWTAPTEPMLSGEATLDSYTVPVDPYDPAGTTFYGVEPGTYSVSLEFIDGGGVHSDPAIVNVTVLPLAPGAPTEVEGHADGTNVTVSWTGDGSATSFEVALAGQTLTAAGSASQIAFGGVAPGTYAITVRAINGGGSSTPGSGSVVVTGDTRPGAPQNVASSDDADLAVTITWDAPASDGGAPVTGYRVTVSFPNGPGCNDGEGGTKVCSYTNGQPISGTSRSTVIYGLPADQGQYTVNVVATNSVGAGPASAATALRTMVRSTVASAPAATSATSPSPNKVTVTWTAPADGGKPITDYGVALTQKIFGFVDGSARSMTLTGVPAGSYTASVFAYNANGSSLAGTASVVVANPVVVPPAVAPVVTGPAPAPVVPKAVAPVVVPKAVAPVVAAPVVPTAPRSLRATVPSRGAVLTSWTGMSTVKGARVTGYIVTFAGQEKRLGGTKVAFGNVTKGTWQLKVLAVSSAGTSVAATKMITVTTAKGAKTRLTLKPGLRGTDVKKLQAALRMPLKARTGHFTAPTRTKVLAWQKANKVRQTGIVDHAMRLKLKV